MSAFMFPKVSVSKDGKECEGRVIVDNNGIIMEKKEALELIEKIRLYYGQEGIEDYIKSENEIEYFKYFGFPYDKQSGLFLFKTPVVVKREAKKSEREWAFKCKCCGKRWSNKNRSYYYVSKFFTPITVSKMACSEECAEQINIDLQKEWIRDNGYGHFFGIYD